jgi:hypothetical protein
LSVTSDRSVFFSVSSGFLHQYNWPHDITQILLKVALSTIKLKPKAYINRMHCIKYLSYVLFKLSLDNNCFCSFFFFVVAENDKTTYIELSAFSSTVAMILLIALVITCIRFVNIFVFYLNSGQYIIQGFWYGNANCFINEILFIYVFKYLSFNWTHYCTYM